VKRRWFAGATLAVGVVVAGCGGGSTSTHAATPPASAPSNSAPETTLAQAKSQFITATDPFTALLGPGKSTWDQLGSAAATSAEVLRSENWPAAVSGDVTEFESALDAVNAAVPATHPGPLGSPGQFGDYGPMNSAINMVDQKLTKITADFASASSAT
jgi:hypothetical protein